MTNEQREKMWSAYLDGELSASEAAHFDESLTPGQRNRLAAEMRMESALAETLSHDAACPEDVWLHTLDRIQGTAKRKTSPFRRWFYGVGALAAVIALIVTAFVLTQKAPEPVFLTLSANESSNLSNFDGSLDSAQRYLRERGVNIRLRPFDSVPLQGHFGARIIGAREVHYRSEPVYELYYECCGQPLKVVLAQKGSAAASKIDEAMGRRGMVQASRDVGEFRAALVGKHESKGLLDQIEIGDIQA